MQLENIFATSLCLFLLMIAVKKIAERFNLWPHDRYYKFIVIAYTLSRTVTIITAIMWIWRAWG